MSTDPSSSSHQHPLSPDTLPHQNGSQKCAPGTVNDQELLRDVSEIVEKVAELEKSVPCQLSAHDIRFQWAAVAEEQSRTRGSEDVRQEEEKEDVDENNTGSGKSRSGRTMNSSTTSEDAATMGASPADQDNGRSGTARGQQSSSTAEEERLIIKLDSNKSSASCEAAVAAAAVSGGAGDNNNNSSGSVVVTSTTAGASDDVQCPAMNEDEIKALVKELKRKIEYTERMNWLCLSRRWTKSPQRKTSLGKHQEVKKRFLQICDIVFAAEVRAALRLPTFDCYEFVDASTISLIQTMFLELDLHTHFGIPLNTLREWLYEVYKHYNDVPFHNFRHCFCVTQMMYAIVWRADLVARLGHLEVLILLVSCICHDLDHPGYNNIYQINARTELALRYNDISPLENHHCSIAFRLFEHPDTNIFGGFSQEAFKEVREGIIRCILATDMARHNEIITQFQETSAIFDYSNKAHTNIMCMMLIKVADISNEARPLDVAEPWLDRLLQEFFSQSAAEKVEGLPVTPFMDPDKVSRTGSQVRFIGLVLLPLFETLALTLTELNEFIIQPARVALEYYKKLNESQARTRRSIADTEYSSEGGGSGSPQMPRSQSGISVRSKRSLPSQKSNSRTSVDEPMGLAAELHDLPEGSESGDSETATEVDVAEKASKFKVDTESSGRKGSQPPSRKTSKEKRPSMCVEMYNSSRIRGSYGNIHNHNHHRSHFGANRAVSLDAQCQSRRMSSDGIQSVISDSSVFYHHHHNNNNYMAISNSSNNNAHPVTTTHPHLSSCINTTNSTPVSGAYDPDKSATSNPSGQHHPPEQLPAAAVAPPAPVPVVGGKKPKREFRFRSLRVASSSSPPPQPPLPPHLVTSAVEAKSENNSNVRQFSAAASAANAPIAPGPRSFIARLRQLTGKFSFSFDHHQSPHSHRPTSAACSSSTTTTDKLPAKVSHSDAVAAAAAHPASANPAGTASSTTAALSSNKNVNLRNAQTESSKNLNNKMLLSKQFSNVAYVQNKHAGGTLQRSPIATKLKNLDDGGIVCNQPVASSSGGCCVRNRAYSLDVPTKRYSSGSSSRKSSTSNRNEDEPFMAAAAAAYASATINNNGSGPGTCITCSYCSAELIINAEGQPGPRGPRHININVNSMGECGGGSGDVSMCCDDHSDGGLGSGRRKTSDGDNELSGSFLMNNRVPSSTSTSNNSGKNVNI